MADVIMPRLSDTMEEGVLSQWLKQEGDPVRKGDVLAEIETDKATMELEAYDEGVLEQLLVPEGATVPIGQPIAVIGDGSDTRHRRGAGTPPAAQPRPSPAEAPGSLAAGTCRPCRTRHRGCRSGRVHRPIRVLRPRSPVEIARELTASTLPPSPAPGPAGGSSGPTSRHAVRRRRRNRRAPGEHHRQGISGCRRIGPGGGDGACDGSHAGGQADDELPLTAESGGSPPSG